MDAEKQDVIGGRQTDATSPEPSNGETMLSETVSV